MKRSFRNRIILLFVFLSVCSGVLINLIVWKVLEKSWTEQAIEKAYEEYCSLVNKLHGGINMTDKRNDMYYKYQLKKNAGDYDICISFETGEVIYNPTILTVDELKSFEFKEMERNEQEQCITKIKNGKYCITKGGFSDYELYHLTPIDYVQDDIWDIIKILSVVLSFVLIVSGIGFTIFLNYHFKPLEELKERVNHIAKGDYESEIIVRNRDEIGCLAESVNDMSRTILMRSECIRKEQENKSRFMGSFAHELKTPMTVISGYAQTLLNVDLSEDDRKLALNYMISESNRIEKLSKTLMKLFELEQDNNIEMKSIAVDELFSLTVDICKPVLDEKAIDLVIDSDGDTYCVNEVLFVDALRNLVENAIKASQDGGKIILCSKEKCISVTDFGMLIPEEEIEHLTEAFYMVDKSRSRKNGGSGLGLTLVNTIVKRHGADLSISQSEEKGKTFYILFKK